jgi:hypothetical protein
LVLALVVTIIGNLSQHVKRIAIYCYFKSGVRSANSFRVLRAYRLVLPLFIGSAAKNYSRETLRQQLRIMVDLNKYDSFVVFWNRFVKTGVQVGKSLLGPLDESDGEGEGEIEIEIEIEVEGEVEGEGVGEGVGVEGIARVALASALRATQAAAATEGASEHIVPLDLRMEWLVRKIKLALKPKSSNLKVPHAVLVSRVVELAEEVTSNFKDNLNVVHNSVHHTTPKVDLEITRIANCLVDNAVFRDYELQASKPCANIENAAYQKIANGYIAKVVAAVRPIPYTKEYHNFVVRGDHDEDDDDADTFGGLNLRLHTHGPDYDAGLGVEEGDEDNATTMYIF